MSFVIEGFVNWVLCNLEPKASQLTSVNKRIPAKGIYQLVVHTSPGEARAPSYPPCANPLHLTLRSIDVSISA